MDKSLLKFPIVVEIKSDGEVIYYSRKKEQDIASLITSIQAEASPAQEYCHECFNIPCTCNK